MVKIKASGARGTSAKGTSAKGTSARGTGARGTGVRGRAHLDDPEGTIFIPPDEYLGAVRQTLGIIELDPCSTGIAQKAIEAQGWYQAQDAEASLAEPWNGTVFLHPHPNTRIARWQLQKLLRDYLADRVTAAIILSSSIDWLRGEPLLLSFPFLIHYRRLQFWRWQSAERQLSRFNPSTSTVTHYLPAKQSGGRLFDETALARFTAAFTPFGRVILSEDLGENWSQHALAANHRAHIKPVLIDARLDRYGVPEA